ncbi:MAG: sodium-dependent transporter, partial [Gemmatimonadota bacterium]
DELDFWAGTFGLFVFGAIEIIIFSWVFGIRRGWEEINRGADIRVPRIFRFILVWVTPVLMIGIFVYWTLQNAVDTALMVGIEASSRPFVIGARVFMLAALIALLAMIRVAWRRHGTREAGRT